MNTLEIDTAPLASKQNLQQACAEAKATLRAWAAVPQERKLTGCIAQFKYLQSPVAKEHRRLGGLEGIHMAFIMANLDANNDGTVGEKEYQAFIAQGNEMVEGAKGLCLNNGVLSTLLISIMYPLVSSPQQISDETLNFFCGESSCETGVVYGLEAVTQLLLGACLLLAVISLYVALRVYTGTEELAMFDAVLASC